MIRFLFLTLVALEMAEGLKYADQTCPVNAVLSGKEMKVAIGEVPSATMIFRDADGNVTGYGGFIYEQLLWISLHLNFSLSMEASKDVNFGQKMANGTWDGMRGQLVRQEVDIACSGFTGFIGYEAFELAMYVGFDGYGILTPYPIPRTSNYAHYLTFSPNVWIGVFISTILCVGCIKFLIVLHRKYLILCGNGSPNRGFATLADIFIYIFATLTTHGVYYRHRYRSIGIMAFTWCLVTFFLVNIYSSCLTSYMSLTFQRPDVSSFSDLVMNPKYQLAVVKGTTPENVFLQATSGNMKLIGDKLRRCAINHGECTLSNFDYTVQKIFEGNFVAILPETMIRMYVLKMFTNRKCQLTRGQEKITYAHYFMGVSKNSSFVMEYNQASYWWHSFGFKVYWLKKLTRTAPQCILNYNNKGDSVKLVERVPLKLEQFYTAFIVLFTGYLLAFIQFLRERYIHHQ